MFARGIVLNNWKKFFLPSAWLAEEVASFPGYNLVQAMDIHEDYLPK